MSKFGPTTTIDVREALQEKGQSQTIAQFVGGKPTFEGALVLAS